MNETMTDIVERLRQHQWGGTKPSIFSDAADEIERLRAHAFTLGELDDKIASAVAAERAAILDLIETFEYRPSRSTTGAVLEDIVSAIKARGTE